jgi:polysaccharide pyruvyl transferase WcaK-like protein
MISLQGQPSADQSDEIPLRIGLFGLLGLGNSGNEASVEAMLAYLRSVHPDAAVDVMSAGAERARAIFGLEVTPLAWYERYQHDVTGPIGIFLRIFGKIIDPLRIISWVRRHDLIIVPGMGVLEATTPLRAYGFPFSMFMLSAAGRLCRVKVALVSVGASRIKQRATRRLLNAAASMAAYRSYRDTYSAGVMRERGVDTSKDQIFPDLAFSLPVPAYNPGDAQLVGVGVMDFHGGNDDRAHAAEIYSAYLEKMTEFVQWLLDEGFSVRLFGGDDSCDYAVAQEILTSVTRFAQDAEASSVAEIAIVRPSSYAEMLAELNDVGTVVATRYHNVLAALLLCKPTVAVGYAQKFVSLMEAMGVTEFSQLAHELDVARLKEQFSEVQRCRTELSAELIKRNAANVESGAAQFALLTATLPPPR